MNGSALGIAVKSIFYRLFLLLVIVFVVSEHIIMENVFANAWPRPSVRCEWQFHLQISLCDIHGYRSYRFMPFTNDKTANAFNLLLRPLHDSANANASANDKLHTIWYIGCGVWLHASVFFNSGRMWNVSGRFFANLKFAMWNVMPSETCRI